MNAEYLVMTHFSQRYPQIPKLKNTPVSSRTAIAFDHMEVLTLFFILILLVFTFNILVTLSRPGATVHTNNRNFFHSQYNEGYVCVYEIYKVIPYVDIYILSNFVSYIESET